MDTVINSLIRRSVFRIFRFIKNRQPKPRYSKISLIRILIYPELNNTDLCLELLQKINIALPEKRNLYFSLKSGSQKVKNLLNVDTINHLSPEGHQIEKLRINFVNHFIFKDYDLILCHQTSKLISLFFHLGKTEVVNKNFYSFIEGIIFQRLYYSIISDERKIECNKLSLTNFTRLKEKFKGTSNAYCYLTGPSISSYKDFKIKKNSLKIICNSLVKNHSFNQFIGGPDIITFADPIFHFGASDYAVRFRNLMFETASKYNASIVVPSFTVPLLLDWFPVLKENIIGLDTIESENINFPDPNNMWVKASDNIFTMFVLPLACSFANNVYIAGADGREEKESYFWKFDDNSQFTGEMNTVFKSHPSFFRDRNYSSYYDEHCRNVDLIIRFAENNGKTISSLTPSYIPCLRTRYQKDVN